MKSGKVRSGLKVVYVTRCFLMMNPWGFSTPTDQSPERVLGSGEEFAEFGAPEVVVMGNHRREVNAPVQ